MSGCRLKLLCGAWVIRAFLASFVSRLGYRFGSAAVVIRRDSNGFGFIFGYYAMGFDCRVVSH